MRRLIIAGLFLVTPTTLSAQSPASQDAQGAEAVKIEAARRLAETVKSRETLLSDSDYAFGGDLAAQMQQDPNVAALERDYPGIVQHMVLSVRDETERQVVATAPALWDRLARLFIDRLTLAEIEQLAAYYASPAGQNFLRAVRSNYDHHALVANALDQKEFAVTGAGLLEGLQTKLPEIEKSLSTADREGLLAFAKTAGFSKLQTINPEILKIHAEWANESTPEEDAKIEQLMTEAVTEFIEAADARRASDD